MTSATPMYGIAHVAVQGGGDEKFRGRDGRGVPSPRTANSQAQRK
jgi:hypothetical protein